MTPLRKARILLVLSALVARPSWMAAQCDGCATDPSCSSEPAYPTLCPAQPPDATAGVPYAADITFWLPQNFTDPGTGFNVDFLTMTITGVTGLPYGLSISYSEPAGVYHPQENQYGCTRICGTPLGAGTYIITINIIATVLYSGLTINAPEQFPITLVVLPGTGSNTGFTYTPSSGCAPVAVEFQALIDGQGDPVDHSWDFGDGASASGPQVEHLFTAPGEYVVSLQTSIGGFVLNTVQLGGVNDEWCGDVEEPSLFGSCTGSPDLYFVLTDGSGNGFTGATINNSGTALWSAVGRPLNNPPYSIAFYDEDLISQDDHLGTYNLPQGTSGQLAFTLGNGTFGSLQIDAVTQQVFNDTDLVMIFPAPDLDIAYDTAAATICVSGTTWTGLLWLHDSDTVAAGTPCIPAEASGLWWAEANNAFGCTTITDTIVICPQLAIQQNGQVLFTTTGLFDYQWTWNGSAINGANGPFLIAESEGVYTVSAMNANGCSMSATYALLANTSEAETAAPRRLRVLPSAGSGPFTIHAPVHLLCRVHDLLGRQVRFLERVPTTGTLVIPEGALQPGSYLVVVETPSGALAERLEVLR